MATASAKKADKKTAKKKTGGRKKKAKAEPDSRGLAAAELTESTPPRDVVELADAVKADGGSVLAVFRDPLGGHWQILAGLPTARVEPTPFQRDLSPTHVERLTTAIDKLGRYLDPVICYRTSEGRYWTPNGYHRSEAVKALGGRSLTALVVPEEQVARRILLLNTEKAHNLKERSLEVIRLAEAIADIDPRPESEFETEFEEAALLTLGLCYQERGRFAGGAFRPVLKRVDAFLGAKLPDALETRRERAAKVLRLEDAVNEAVASLKTRGFESPYLKAFVVARVNPIRFQRGAAPGFDETVDKMLAAAERFDTGKVRVDQLARTGGPAEE